MARVLVVEDNPVNMKLAVFLLQNAGHHVLCAVDAELALTTARAQRPDLILMDYQLPVMDGLAATALLKQHPNTATIPVVMVTALTLPSAALGDAPHPFDACVCKPLRYQELYAVVNTLLSKKPRQAIDICQGSPAIALQTPQATVAASGAPQVGQALAAVVDVRVLEALVGHNPPVVRGLLAEFETSAAAIGLELQAACAARQAVFAGQLAHKLKSAACAVGAAALGQRCATMEAVGKAGDSQHLATLWPLLALELQAVHQFLEAFLASALPHPIASGCAHAPAVMRPVGQAMAD